MQGLGPYGHGYGHSGKDQVLDIPIRGKTSMVKTSIVETLRATKVEASILRP